MNSGRVRIIDTVRGFMLINMILYHTLWDMVYIYNFDLPWYRSIYSEIWQKMICSGFIFISGMCRNFGKKHLKRGIIISIWGVAITLATVIFMPKNRIIFGILTFFGFTMLVLIPFDKFLDKINPFLGGGIFFALFLYTRNINSGYVGIFMKTKLPEFIYSGMFMTFLGFKDSSFFSVDYFPLLPWIFLYICGIFTGKTEGYKKISDLEIPFLSFCGKHSLLIYILHQPIIYCVTRIILFSR